MPGRDSIKNIEILMTAQVKFGFKFNFREIEQLTSVGDLMRLEASKPPPAR